jgi:hypothetical protein
LINKANFLPSYLKKNTDVYTRSDLLATFLSAVVGLFRKKDRTEKKAEGRQTIRRRDRDKKKVYSDSDGEYVDFEEVKK